MLVLTAGLGSIAAAQPGPPPAPPPPPADTTTTTTTTTVDPAPPDVTPPQPQPQPRAMPAVQEEPAQTDRPDGFSIGLGLGYGLPTSLETPNRTSARLRLASGLTFEPLISIANTTATSEAPATPEQETKTTEFGLAVLARLPVITHNHVDLEALATAGFTNTKVNGPVDYDTRTTNTFGVGWGIGIGYWMSRHWQLSMSVTNPLVQYQQVKQQMGPGMSDKDASTTIGVIFVPQVTAMIHLYN
ncbi:MAG TPA: outer membrane beta-barrel protein [Kofleriaceae bacterium]